MDDLGASEEDSEDEPLWKRMQELRGIYKPIEGVKSPEFTRLNVDFQDTGNVYEGARWTDVNSRKHTDEDGEREDEALARRLQEEEWAEQPSAAEASRRSANKTWVFQSTAVVPVGQSSPLEPARLVQGLSHGPRSIQYQFSDTKQMDDFIRELEQEMTENGGLLPILPGRYTRDPSIRPQVDICNIGSRPLTIGGPTGKSTSCQLRAIGI